MVRSLLFGFIDCKSNLSLWRRQVLFWGPKIIKEHYFIWFFNVLFYITYLALITTGNQCVHLSNDNLPYYPFTYADDRTIYCSHRDQTIAIEGAH